MSNTCNCVFKTPTPITFDVVLTKSEIVERAVSILNKIAEARYDGQNAAYVNNLQPEMDFEQDADIVNDFYEDGIMRVVKRIEPYVSSEDAVDRDSDTYTISLSFPQNWKSEFQNLLIKRIKDYLVYMIIAHWVEKVSINDTNYSMEKAEELLYELRHTCDMRQGAVHRSWNTPY